MPRSGFSPTEELVIECLKDGPLTLGVIIRKGMKKSSFVKHAMRRAVWSLVLSGVVVRVSGGLWKGVTLTVLYGLAADAKGVIDTSEVLAGPVNEANETFCTEGQSVQ